MLRIRITSVAEKVASPCYSNIAFEAYQNVVSSQSCHFGNGAVDGLK
jgi:hypothetical protein